jgi:hypothetical protein
LEEEKMTFALSDLFAYVIAIVGLILTVLNIIDKRNSLKKQASEPFEKLRSRVDAHDVEISDIKMALKQGNDRFREQEKHDKMQEETNEVMQLCMLALIDFELSYCSHTDYSHTEDLEKAKDVLRTHLTRKINV